MYNLTSLKLAIEKAKENIAMFEGEIQKQKDTIVEYKGYVEEVKKQETLKKEQDEHIEIIRE